MDITVSHATVADFDGTSLEDTFNGFPGDQMVVQAWDADTDTVCALVRAEGQPVEDLEREARFKLVLRLYNTGPSAPVGATDWL